MVDMLKYSVVFHSRRKGVRKDCNSSFFEWCLIFVPILLRKVVKVEGTQGIVGTKHSQEQHDFVNVSNHFYLVFFIIIIHVLTEVKGSHLLV